jgi:hypothetical protein
MLAVLVLIAVTLARAFGGPSWLFMVAGAAGGLSLSGIWFIA